MRTFIKSVLTRFKIQRPPLYLVYFSLKCSQQQAAGGLTCDGSIQHDALRVVSQTSEGCVRHHLHYSLTEYCQHLCVIRRLVLTHDYGPGSANILAVFLGVSL